MVHYCFQLTLRLSLWYTTLFYWTTGNLFGTPSIFYWHTGYHYGTQPSSTDWLSLWYTTIFYWPNDHLYGTHPSIGPLALPVYTNMFYLPTELDRPVVRYYLWYTTIFYWSTGYLCGTLLSPTGTLPLPIVHNFLLLGH